MNGIQTAIQKFRRNIQHPAHNAKSLRGCSRFLKIGKVCLVTVFTENGRKEIVLHHRFFIYAQSQQRQRTPNAGSILSSCTVLQYRPIILKQCIKQSLIGRIMQRKRIVKMRKHLPHFLPLLFCSNRLKLRNHVHVRQFAAVLCRVHSGQKVIHCPLKKGIRRICRFFQGAIIKNVAYSQPFQYAQLRPFQLLNNPGTEQRPPFYLSALLR